MVKCEYCGKEVLLPFKCPYCGKNFCVEHRLPEKHDCIGLPKEPFWYQRKAVAEKEETKELEREIKRIQGEEKKLKIEPKRAKRKLSVKKIVVVPLLAILCLIMFIYVVPRIQYLFTNVKYYHFGEEIEHFPIEKTAVTFTAWEFKKEVYVSKANEGCVFVVINFTVRNIYDTKLGFQTLCDFHEAKAPILKYGNYYAGAEALLSYRWNFYDPYVCELMPNQTLTGYIYYEILEGYQPQQLLYPNKDAPSIVINIET